MNQNLTAYYHDRAKEYDKVYETPEEQEDLLKATILFQTIFQNKSVLEIACGTGYWTEQIAKTATSIFATDINQSVIDIAAKKSYKGNVTFEVADMNTLNTTKKFDGFFGGFIWSHIPLQNLDSSLSRINNQLTEGGDIVFIDSRQVEGKSHDKTRTTRTDEYGNTFQIRQIENGTTYEVLKNFPDRDFLIDKLSPFATDIEITELEYYWIAICKRKASADYSFK